MAGFIHTIPLGLAAAPHLARLPLATSRSGVRAGQPEEADAATKLGCVPDEPSPDAAYPWPAQSATGVGSMPGTDPLETMRLIMGELPGLPFLAELPGRGPGADLTGRTAAMLVELPAETTPRGWRLAGRPGRDLRRAQSLLAQDLDALAEVAEGFAGVMKISACGPWTMAATIELTRSQEPVLADRGAVGDLTASLAEGVARHVAEVAARLPGARLLLQLDEPALPGVLAGAVPSASGLNRVRAVEPADAESGLRTVLDAAGVPVLVHCCAPSAPLGMIRDVGAVAAGIDLGQLRPGEEEVLAAAVEAGLGVFAGAVPATPVPVPARAAAAAGRQRTAQSAQRRSGQQSPATAAAVGVTELWRRMGWPVDRPSGAAASLAARVAAQVVITPACGLAGAPPEYARAALASCREAARMLPELIEEESR